MSVETIILMLTEPYLACRDIETRRLSHMDISSFTWDISNTTMIPVDGYLKWIIFTYLLFRLAYRLQSKIIKSF